MGWQARGAAGASGPKTAQRLSLHAANAPGKVCAAGGHGARACKRRHSNSAVKTWCTNVPMPQQRQVAAQPAATPVLVPLSLS